MATDQTKTEIRANRTEARQGVTGHNVRYVLAGSLALVIAAMILTGIFAI